MRAIIVPLDGSAFAEHALPWGVALARRSKSRLHVVAALESAPPVAGEATGEMVDRRFATRLRLRLQEYLASTKERLAAADPSLVIVAELLEGRPAPALAAYARTLDADLIVMTTHGHGGLSRLWLGSVSHALLRQADAGVLVVRPREGEGPPPDPRLRRVLVALDDTPESAHGADAAISLGGTAGVEYVLLHVVTPLHPLVRAVVSDEEVERDRAAEVQRAEQLLATAQERLRGLGAEVRATVQLSSNTARAIVGEAEELGADLIVLASKPRAPLERLLVGSVSDRVARLSDIPVLLAKAPG